MTLFESEISEIAKLLKPGRRRRVEALARLRPVVIFDANIRGEKDQPSDADLGKVARQLAEGEEWTKVFPGIAAIDITTDGTGPTLSLRISKKEGIPIQLVPEGTPGATVVAVRRVNELDVHSLGAKDLAEKIGVRLPKLIAVVEYAGIRRNQEYYKEFKIGSQTHKRYSPEAIVAIKNVLNEREIEDIWKEYRQKRKRVK